MWRGTLAVRVAADRVVGDGLRGLAGAAVDAARGVVPRGGRHRRRRLDRRGGAVRARAAAQPLGARRPSPGPRQRSRWWHRPLATIRACDHLARELAGDLDPLWPRPRWRPRPSSAPSGGRDSSISGTGAGTIRPRAGRAIAAGGTVRWSRAWSGRCATGAFDPDALLAQPAPDGADVIAWCPCCLAQYRGGGAAPRACANAGCGGIVLCRFG